MWKPYDWADLDPDDLPWLAPSNELVPSEAPPINELSDPMDRTTAIGLGFDPNHTYHTVLARMWNGHPAGTRVLLEALQIAVEQNAPAHAVATHPANATNSAIPPSPGGVNGLDGAAADAC